MKIKNESELERKYLEKQDLLHNLETEREAIKRVQEGKIKLSQEDTARYIELGKQIESLKAEIADLSKQIKDAKDVTSAKEEEGSYHLLGENLEDNKLETYRQVAKRTSKSQHTNNNNNNSNSASQSDTNNVNVANSNEDKLEENYIEAEFTERSKIEQFILKHKNAIIGTLIGASAVVGAYIIGASKNNSNKENIVIEDVIDTPMPEMDDEITLEAAPLPMEEDKEVAPLPMEENKEVAPAPIMGEEFQNAVSEDVDALMNKGYSEYAAKLMSSNMPKETINYLLDANIPYTAAVENYADVPEFVYSYIADYENARTIYNLTPASTVDYVNRSYVLASYNLFEGAEINDYVKFVAGIDNRDLYTHENDEASLLMNDVTNKIFDHFISSQVTGTNQITSDDYNKLTALRYIARDGSDLDNAIESYIDIIINCLNEPNNNEVREKGYKFLEIFVKSLNGIDNPLNHSVLIPDSTESNILTDDEAFNESAKVENASDWLIAYDNVVGPLLPIMIPSGDGNDEAFIRYDELLQCATSIRDIVFANECGISRTLESGE